MNSKVYDYIIVGQGLAGTALACQLLSKNKSLLIFDSPVLQSSSKAAAGIFNPITGRRWVTTWRAREIFNYFPRYYREMENITSSKFFFEKPIYRSFQNRQEQNDWIAKTESERSEFIKEIKSPGEYAEYIDDAFGGLLLNNSGYLDVTSYLDASKRYFRSQEIYKEEVLNLGSIKWESPFELNGFKSMNLILCTGFEGTSRTPFGEKPFNPVKGELLIAKTDVDFPNVVFNGPVFVLPQEDGILKIGATYDFQDKSVGITEKALEDLIRKSAAYLKTQFKIQSQVAGFRPSSVDRRPVVGEHPEIPNLGILNGLGTKGVSLAPYVAKLLIEKFENGKELDREIDIKRFFD